MTKARKSTSRRHYVTVTVIETETPDLFTRLDEMDKSARSGYLRNAANMWHMRAIGQQRADETHGGALPRAGRPTRAVPAAPEIASSVPSQEVFSTAVPDSISATALPPHQPFGGLVKGGYNPQR